jgi:phage tail sheath protein FI
MAFAHGITVNELPTSVTAPTEADSAIPFVVGTAPINLSATGAPVNKPILAYTYAEAVAALGYSEDWESYTLCEFIYSHFKLYGLAPVVFVNVLDPAVHKSAVASTSIAMSNRVATIPVEGVLLDSLVVKSADGSTTYVKDTDYTAAFNDDGYVVITGKTSGAIAADTTSVSVSYNKLNPGAVDADDIIGGVGVDGTVTGLELINQVYPRFGVLPGLVLAPGWSDKSVVASVMVAKAGNINGNFKAVALTDIPTDTVTTYTDAPAWKSQNSYSSERQIVTYPMASNGSRNFHLSTLLAGRIGQTDADNGGIPYVSPSNKALPIDGSVLVGGADMFLGIDQATYLNSQGIVTAANFGTSGWRLWGNQTGAYPATTDPKDSFISLRRMFDWVANSIILTYMQKVDDPANRRLINTVTDGLNIWLNGLTASGALLGGRVEFNSSENPATDLLAGKLTFHLYLTPPSPAQEISFLLEYDTSYLSALTAA